MSEPSKTTAVVTTPQTELQAPTIQSPPPQAENLQSIEFMLSDLARSGLKPVQGFIYPTTQQFLYGAMRARYVLLSGDGVMWQVRRDVPRNGGLESPLTAKDPSNLQALKTQKYSGPKGHLDVMLPPGMTVEDYAGCKELFVIEGYKKMLRFLKQWPHIKAVAITGCDCMFKDGGLVPSLRKILRHSGVDVNVILDGDIYDNKKGVGLAGSNIVARLSASGYRVRLLTTPSENGVDDWLESLVQAPTPIAPAITDLREVDLTQIARSRLAGLAQAGCIFGDKGLYNNTTNVWRALTYYYGGRVVNDVRLGLLVDGVRTNGDDFRMQARTLIQTNHFAIKDAQVSAAVEQLVRSNEVDVVADACRSVKWDGEPRLDTYGSKLFKTSSDVYANKWFQICIVTLAMRILYPGCKADHVSILGGPQGRGKSTFFERLSEFVGEKFYSAVTVVPSSGGDANRTLGVTCAKSVVLDLSEGVAFSVSKEDIDNTKHFISLSTDEHRPVYAKSMLEILRRYIIVGTTNRKDFIGDSTGSRRYNILWAEKIQYLDQDIKMQLIAEAAERIASMDLEGMNRGAHLGKEWWRLTVDRQYLPPEMLLGREHITDIQALVNTAYTAVPAEREWIRELLERNYLPQSKDYANTKFVNLALLDACYCEEHSYPRSPAITKSLKQAFKHEVLDPTSKWIWDEKARPTLSALDLSNSPVKPDILGGSSGGQLRGFFLTAKPLVAVPQEQAGSTASDQSIGHSEGTSDAA